MTNWQALIIALGLAFTGVVMVTAQQSGPNAINGCIYIAGGVTLDTFSRVAFQCDINGKLYVNTAHP